MTEKSTLIWLLAFVWGATVSGQTNRIENFSFELPGNSSSNAYRWENEWSGYERVSLSSGIWDGSYTIKMTGDIQNFSGASQRVFFNQTEHVPILITARVRGESIANISSDKHGAILYCRVKYQDGSMAHCPTTHKTKNIGTFHWRYIGINTATLVDGDKSIEWIDVVPMLGAVSGTAYFDDIHTAEYHPGSFRGAVTFIFDDGYKEHLNFAVPTMTSYGWFGVLGAVTDYLSSGDPAYCNWSDAIQIRDAGWEITSHSVNHPNMASLGPIEMEDQLYWSRRRLLENGIQPKSFILPFGEYNAFILGINQEREYYSAIRNSDEGFNPMGSFPNTIRVQKIESDTTLSDINNWLDEARKRRAWVILLFHKIRPVCPDRYCVSENDFLNILATVQSSTLPVVTMEGGLDLVKSPR